MKERPKVELHLAYSWTCDDCGRGNFTHGMSPEYDTELEWQMKEHFGYGINDGGQFMMRPDKVTCGHCGETFETEDWGGEDSDDGTILPG